jgi:hypothetical protein
VTTIFRSLLALSLLLLGASGFTADNAAAADFTCVNQISGAELSAANKSKLLVEFPSGRLPQTGQCSELLISGPIQKGDARKFSDLLQRSHPFLQHLFLNSPGGLVDEAMAIGKMVRRALVETWAPRINRNGQLYFSIARKASCAGATCQCASACFLIWAAGVERQGWVLGLHRPSTTDATYVDLRPSDAAPRYREQLTKIRDYLEEMDTPRRYVDLMVDTNSADMTWLTQKDEDGLSAPASIAEWIKSSCGAVAQNEKDTRFELEFQRDYDGKRLSAQEKTFIEQVNLKYMQVFHCRMKRLNNARDVVSIP